MRAAIYRLLPPTANLPVIEYAASEQWYEDADALIERIGELEASPALTITGIIPQWLVCIDCAETRVVRNGRFL